MSEINFNFSPYDENIVIVGGAGNGKSYRTKWFLSQVSNLPYIVYDYNCKTFSGFGKIVHNINEIRKDQIIFQPIHDRSYNTFIKFCNKIFYDAQHEILNDIIVVFDELHQYLTKQRICLEYNQIVQTARNYGVSSVHVSTRPASIPNTTLSNTQHCFAFALSNKSDIEWLEDYIGVKVWHLLPRDKRHGKYPELKEVTKHTCIYRNQYEPESQIMLCYCEQCNQQRQNFPEVYL